MEGRFVRMCKTVVSCLVVVLFVLAQSGCTFFACSGGGPLKREELGDWAGIPPKPPPDAKELESLVSKLKLTPNRTFAGKFSLRGDSGAFSINYGGVQEIPFTPAPGLKVQGRVNHWLLFVPGPQHGEWLYHDPSKENRRQFYASEDEWDCLVAWGERADAYDVASRERVAAQRTTEVIGFGLGWTRLRRVRPVDRVGDPGLNALADTRVGLSDVLYDLRDGNIVLLGVFGWGRVNHRRYIQILWIPICLGQAGG